MKVNKLGDIACFSQGIQVAIDKQYNKIEEGYVRFLRIIDYTQNKDEIRYIDNPGERYLVNNNDVVMIRYGDAGKVVKGYEGAIANNLFKICIDEKLIIREYLYYYLSQENIYKQLTNSQQKTGLPAVNFKTVSEIKIVYPESIAIQKNIVKILDKAQELIDKRKEQIESLDELVKSKFIEMFGDPITNRKGWNTAKLGDICTISRGGSPRPIDKFLGGPIPWIKIGDATKGDDIYLYKTKEGIIEEGVKKSRLIKKGGLIFANCGVSLGFARILKIDGCIHDGWLAFEDFDKYLDKIFFLKSLNYCTEYFRKTAPDGTQPNLNTSIMREYIQILPPMELQQQFTKFIEQVDKLKFEMEKSLKELEDNFNSLMQKAFKGELFN